MKVLLTESSKNWIYIPTKIPTRNCLVFASFCNSNMIIQVQAVIIQMPLSVLLEDLKALVNAL